MTWHERTFAPVGDVPDDRPGIPHAWAAIVVSLTVDTAASIMRGDPVLARNLDPVVLARALRGEPLPKPDEYVTVTVPMLEAINEGGAFGV